MAGTEGVFVAVNGVVSPAAEARVGALDRGLLHGEAVYEVFVARGGRPYFWAEHGERLRRSAAAASFAPWDRAFEDRLLAEVAAACAAVPAPEAAVRLVLTRGADGLELDPPAEAEPTRLVVARPRIRPAAELWRTGCALHPVPVPRQDDGREIHKLTARPEAAAQRAAARQAGAYEALRIDAAGRVLEGSTSSFFGVLEGVLHTAPLGLGLLAGITRAQVLTAAAALGLPWVEAAVGEDQLARLSEAFLTSSTRGVVPVGRIGAVALPTVPGPMTTRLSAAYEALAEASLGGA